MRSLPLLLAGCAAPPTFAMARCPVEPGGIVALAHGVLAPAFGVGLAVVLPTWQHTRALRPGRRALWRLGACVIMLGAWLAALMSRLGAFVLRC